MTGAKSCYGCKHLLRQTESWEMPWVYWYECRARPSVANLWQFPFSRTKCEKWEQREGKDPRPLRELVAKETRDDA
jgi:hypothetical protein